MALHNLKITVVDGGKGGGIATGKSEKQGAKDSPLYKFFNLNETIKGKLQQKLSPAKYFALNSGVSLAKQTARQFVNYYVSDIGRQHGDSNYQDIINRRIEQVTDPLSVAGATLQGAATGAMFGLPGVLLGAAIGAVSSSVNIGFKYAERARAYQHEMFEQGNSQVINLSRANYSLTNNRLR